MQESWATSTGVDLHLDLSLVAASGRRDGLESALREAMRSGRLAPGEKLPSTRALAAQLGLSRGTVAAAYDQLVAEGHLVARHGSGTEVAPRSASGSPRQRVAPRPTAAAPTGRPVQPWYDFRPGSPDASAFPVAAWLRSTRHALGAAPPSAFGYGDPAGRPELREALADYLGRARGVVAAPERIVITSGYVQALALLSDILRRRGVTEAAMEEPGLAFHRQIVSRAGLSIRPLPVDELGIQADLLALTRYSRVGAVVVTAANQFPFGVALAPERRRALAGWAERTGGVVIEDDYDGEFRYDRQPVGALQGMAPDQVVYIGTASKTLGPALRLAWMVLPLGLVTDMAEAKLHADYQTDALSQSALADFITTHAYDRHIRACRLRYRSRRDLLLTRIGGLATAHATLGASVPVPATHTIDAGLHALITLPPGGLDETALIARAKLAGIALEGLAPYWHKSGARNGSRAQPQGIVLGYATPPERSYPAAVDALIRLLSTALREHFRTRSRG
jgi:GntR family transcriptional regulator / MocR family aminotransferase